MTRKLEGKSAVVTGGGSGIGRATALAMAAEGARVVVSDIATEPDGSRTADKVVQEIKRAGGIAVASYDNVAMVQAANSIISTAISNFGRIDILVNCAGNFKAKPTGEWTEEEWDSIINVHLKGHFNCIQAAVREMVNQRSGRIINISSRGAVTGAKSSPYSAAKAGILGLTSSISEELAEYGITVNAVLPSAETKLFPGTSRAGFSLKDNMPAPLWMDPEYVAPTIVYLATDGAQYITGRYIYASGGDICVYARPLRLPGETHMLVRNMGKWTVDELGRVLPSMAK